jgi:hypothetical protein
VFAWGGVVAYAGTGRTPFAADSPMATAARILTQPPDLSGLSGSLRDLVGHALEKEPANRPSARELLDELISGPRRPAATAAALEDQPDLRAAAVEAQAVTGVRVLEGLVGYAEDSIVTVPISAIPDMPTGPPPPEPRRRWFLPVAVATLLLAVVAGAVMMVLGSDRGDRAVASEVPPVAQSSTPAEQLLIDDALTAPRFWQAKSLPAEKASCSFNDALVAHRDTKGVYRCSGPDDGVPGDFRVQVSTRLLTKDSCAGIWFRFARFHGYLLRVCEKNIYLGTHKDQAITTTRTFPLDSPLTVGGEPTTIQIRVVGTEATILRDGVEIGTVPLTDPGITGGRVLLGVYTERGAAETGPYEAAFSNVSIWGLNSR